MNSEWAKWNEPADSEFYQLTKITVPYIRFLDKKIIDLVVKDNNKKWFEKLNDLGISPNYYIWENSACIFPGVRRHIGSKETEAFHKNNHTNKDEAIILDDNSYPKRFGQWYYVMVKNMIKQIQ